jgi:Zn-dependent peptidase ImmA (M78 family)
MNLKGCREQAGLSQEDLGQQVGVTRQTVAAWERTERTPSVAQLAKVAKALGVPMEMLLEQQNQNVDTTLLFRSDQPDQLGPELRTLLTHRSKDYAYIERLVGETSALPPSHMFDGYVPDQAEQMAREIRDWLGIEQAPVGDVFSLLENRGLKVILHELPEDVSGFSAFTEELGAVIFINRRHPTERQYFTAMHELGHLVFHRRDYGRPEGVRTKDKEKMADHFAGAVLMPRNVLEKELRAYRNKWLPEPLLADLKLRYQVSMRTIVVRAGQLNVIQKKQSFQQYRIIANKYGSRHEVPILRAPETLSRLNRLVYRALLMEEITVSRAAEILGDSLVAVHDELRKWLDTGEVH